MLDSRAARSARWLRVWAVLLACSAGEVAAQSAASGDQAYRQTTDEAVREFEAGHWEEARALFKRAHELAPNARTLRGMGMAAFEMRMYVQAWRELDAALRDLRKPLDGELRTHVQEVIDKAREYVGRVRLVTEPRDAKILIDGKTPELESEGSVLLDVGTHVISASAEGYKPSNMRLSVEGGTEQEVRMPLEPLLATQQVVAAIDPNQPRSTGSAADTTPAPPRAHKSNLGTIAWVALAGTGALGIAGGVLWLVGDSQYKDLQNRCETSCSPKQIEASGVKTSDLLTNVFLGVAAAGAVTTAVLFAISAGQHSEPDARAGRERMQLSLRAAPTGVSLEGKF